MSDMFTDGVGVIATQENDHPEWILKGIKQTIPTVKLIKLKKTDDANPSNSAKFLKSRHMGHFDFGKFDIQNDTISIYYNEINGLQECPGSRPQSFLIDGKKTYGASVCFKKGEHTFHVINAHLSSGEDPDKATQRVKEIKAIVDQANRDKNPIILMDSNSSDLYPLSTTTQAQYGIVPTKKFDKKKGKEVNNWKKLKNNRHSSDIKNGDAVLHYLNQHSYTDILENTDNECFKMRHGSGGQPSKFGTLMFDRIDKIIIPSLGKMKGRALNLSDFTHHFIKYNQKLNPHEVREVEEIRNNIGGKRDQLEEMVKTQAWSDIVGMKRGTPIGWDEKGVPNQWNPPYEPLEDNSILPQHIQKALYPNIDAPSDHPPCIAQITFQ